MIKDKLFCINCGKEVFGFWKYGLNHVCSLYCLRLSIADGKISKIPPYSAFRELGILAPTNRKAN
jgi:hypothetical protein